VKNKTHNPSGIDIILHEAIPCLKEYTY
jgi:hypothetical protein